MIRASFVAITSLLVHSATHPSRDPLTAKASRVANVQSARQPTNASVIVRALADAGKIDDAEKLARANPVQLSASLGEVLVMRGRLVQAESVFRATIDRGGVGARTAQAAMAELAMRRGDRADAVKRALSVTLLYEQGGDRWSSDDRVAAGRAYVLLGARNANATKQALSAFESAASADANNLEALLRTGDLFLSTYDPANAADSYNDVLKRSPDHPRALLGNALVAHEKGSPSAATLARKSVSLNPSLVDAHLFIARSLLEAESYDSANTETRRALAIDSSNMWAWALLGASAYLTGDSAEFNLAKAAATKLNPKPANFYVELAEAAGRQRRYADGVKLATQALALDSLSTRALGLLGTNELRAGRIDAGRVVLERAFAIDPFNLWHKNTLDLLDELKKFKTIERGRFRIIAPAKDAELLTTYLLPLLEEAFDTLSNRYKYKPPVPIRLEIYDEHKDFSVRTVGLTGLGALGVSFGAVLAMDAPSARPRGEFNWGSTAWHELAHTFTLGSSNNRVPRWFSEGLSVLEERRARQGWGADASVEFLAAYTGGRLRPVSQLNDGFVRPRFDQETIFSYYEASLVCEMIETQFGMSAITGILSAFREGLETPAAFTRVLKLTPQQMDQRFDTYLRTKFAVALKSIAPNDGKSEQLGGAFVAAMREGAKQLTEGKKDSAQATFTRAQALFPEYGGESSPASYLAQIAYERGNFQGALDQITKVTTRSEVAWDANLLEVSLRERLGDSLSTMKPLERMIWISPNDVAMHIRLASVAARAKNYPIAIRERRAVVAMDPSDPLDARYQLAKVLSDAGDIAGARRELLRVLEQAPSFEKAQALLLELRAKSPGGGSE